MPTGKKKPTLLQKTKAKIKSKSAPRTTRAKAPKSGPYSLAAIKGKTKTLTKKPKMKATLTDLKKKKSPVKRTAADRDKAIAARNKRIAGDAAKKKTVMAKKTAARDKARAVKAKKDSRVAYAKKHGKSMTAQAGAKKVAAARAAGGNKAAKAQSKAGEAKRQAQSFSTGKKRGKAMKKASRLQSKADKKIGKSKK